MDVMTALSIYETDERHPQLEEALKRLIACDAMKYIRDELQDELDNLQRDNQTQKNGFFARPRQGANYNSASL